MMKKIPIILLLFIGGLLNAATYYVAPTTATPAGNDSNAGTIAAPWLTWGKAGATAVAGDTVFFRGGTYKGDSNYLMNPNSGTASNYICFFNYPGEIPILDFNSYSPGSWEYVIRPYNGDNYLHFKGLTVKNFQQKPTSGYIAGIEANGCHHLIFENLRFENIGGPCMGAYGSTEVYFINCDAIGSIDSLATTPGGNGSGFAINTRVDLFDESMYDSRVYFTGCRAWGNGDQGFAMSGQGIVEMTNCWSFDNGRMTGEGYGAKIGFGSTTDTSSTRIIKHCIFAINAYNGLTTNNVGGTAFNVQFYNNFVYRNGFKPTPSDYPYTGAGIWIASGMNDALPNDMWTNNISYANEKGAVVDHGGDAYTHEYNSWDYPGGITITDADFLSLDTLELWYPRQADGSLPDINFGKLIPTSALVDAGQDSIITRDYAIALDYYGDAPDLGWYEYSPGPQIIADHSIVDDYDNIPQYYIDEVKKMWLSYAGESHSGAIRSGLAALETTDATYAVSVVESGTPETYTDANLRTSRATWGDLNNASGWIYGYGEEDWFTSAPAIARTKVGITYANHNGFDLGVLGFGWCWDTAIDSPLEFLSYIEATKEYIDYCSDSISTKVIFTTGTTDIYDGETGYNKYLGYEQIRDSVLADTTRILFDYADILAYDDNGDSTTTTYGAYTYPWITPTNLSPEAYSSHISAAGALRLAKAMWWMLARIAGWDGNVTVYSEPEEPSVDSTATDILTFTLAEQTGAATINTTAHTVAIEIDYTADITDLTPTITLSYGATISPLSGVSQDFTSPVVYTVTALDGVTEQEWTVTVTQETQPVPTGHGFTVKYRGKIVKR